ncbi:hypothetical protein HV819_05170 [Anaerococcus sp. AGMB00486]|uniref:ATP-cone domain-containing protein n=2 Tax=Anaerococcus TaxID=165779 RepID=A0ABX2N9L9_9FIRM|nr:MULTISPECIES: ATP cone domain-containing protein [Anaerococcus]MDY3006806.1 ATP cone domain-containing protein [Anaerococcus porci]MSS78265.1 hypothetical protein [Anaerococcus porci]NVF11378.1 hypothetical protein [Anaerococcus faecalis]
MLDITKLILSYYDKKNLSIEEMSSQLDKAKLEVIENFIDDELYVKKKSTKIEPFSIDKIALSVENAAKEVESPLNSSDLEIIKGDIEKIVKKEWKKIISTKTIRAYVEDILKKDGYTKVYESYRNYMKKLN